MTADGGAPVLVVDLTTGPGADTLADPRAEARAETRPEVRSDARPGARTEGDGAGAGFDVSSLPSGLRGAVEAVLMVVEEPVEEIALASAVGVPVEDVRATVAELAAEYDAAGRGFELRRVAGGWRIFSRAEYAPVVERFVLDGQTAKLTQAALETLAIVAYRQPVSRARVGAVRGVNVDAVMRTLVTRGLVEDAGNDPETGAVLYRTTQYFLQRIGLSSLDELPALAP